MSTLPSIIKFARAWLIDNAGHRVASHVHAGMVHASDAKSDIESAKQWFLNHKSDDSSFLVLTALMHQKRKSNERPDSFAIKQAKQLIASQPLEQSPPALIGTLLLACPDDETFAWARQTYERTKLDWILIALVRTSSDAQITEKAEQRMPDLIGFSIEHEMLYALLKRNPSNAQTQQLTLKVWLLKNSRHPWAKALRTQL